MIYVIIVCVSFGRNWTIRKKLYYSLQQSIISRCRLHFYFVMQYGATFELASRFVSVVKLQQKVARLAKSICEATSQKQEPFSMFSPSPSLFFSLLELTFASLSCGSTPLPRQLALNEAQLAPFPSFLPPPPSSFTFAHVLWQTKFMFFTRFAYALNKSLFSLLFSLVSFLFFYLCFTYFPLAFGSYIFFSLSTTFHLICFHFFSSSLTISRNHFSCE